MQKEVVLGSALVLFGFVIFITSFFLLSNNQKLTGKAIFEEEVTETAEIPIDNSYIPEAECRSGCNPDNSLEICSSGRWIRCPSREVCTLGSCARPVENSADTRIVVGGTGDSGSGGGGGSSGTASPAVPEVVKNTGEIDGTVIQDIGKDEKFVFLSNGKEHSLKITSLGKTDAILENEAGSVIAVSLGESEFIDYESDNDNDIEIILKSIGLTNNKARILINEV